MKTILSLSLLAVVAALSGCSHGGAYEARNAQRYDLENKAPFALMDAQVQRSVTSSGIQKQTLEDGRLRVVAFADQDLPVEVEDDDFSDRALDDLHGVLFLRDGVRN